MKKFYFTFGQNHYSVKGEHMAPYWVTVSAPSYGDARNHFCYFFAKEHMGSSSKWAFQYTEEDFSPKYFPGGEYEHLTANAEPPVDISNR